LHPRSVIAQSTASNAKSPLLVPLPSLVEFSVVRHDDRTSNIVAPARGVAGAVSKSIVGRLQSGEEIVECRLANSLGTQAAILTLGATLRSFVVADAHGHFDDLVLGYDSVEEYLRGSDYFGATVGRYANRIANGRFNVGGRSYQLATNNAPNAEHGGADGFDRRVWTIDGTDVADGAALSLSLVSPDGDQGYPGALTVHLTYALTNDNELRLDYTATTSAVTILNLTHHSYWNLAGATAGDALCARLAVLADAYTPVDAHLIPTGELRPVAGTAFDFRTPQVIAARIRDGSDPQLVFGRGYDHNFVLRGDPGALRPAARLEDPRSGRVLELRTTEPGLQVYTGNVLSGAVVGKARRLYRQGDGIALETQHFPDSPNHPHFPSTLLEPGQVWSSTTVYRFLTQPTEPPAGE
jgi:aldose 1-epimerase